MFRWGHSRCNEYGFHALCKREVDDLPPCANNDNAPYDCHLRMQRVNHHFQTLWSSNQEVLANEVTRNQVCSKQSELHSHSTWWIRSDFNIRLPWCMDPSTCGMNYHNPALTSSSLADGFATPAELEMQRTNGSWDCGNLRLLPKCGVRRRSTGNLNKDRNLFSILQEIMGPLVQQALESWNREEES